MPVEPTRQGQVWTLTSRLSGRHTTVVVIDSDVVIRQRPMLVVAPVREAREVPLQYRLLTVALPDSTQIVALYDIATAAKTTFTEHVSDLPSSVFEQVKIGLRARFDL